MHYNSLLEIGSTLTGIDYLKGLLGLPWLRLTYSERGLGKYIREVKCLQVIYRNIKLAYRI
jgi:hypothetical protein